MKLFTENITEYFAHAQAVCTRPLLGGWGGRGPGDEASEKRYQALSRFTILEARKSWVGPGTKAN